MKKEGKKYDDVDDDNDDRGKRMRREKVMKNECYEKRMKTKDLHT